MQIPTEVREWIEYAEVNQTNGRDEVRFHSLAAVLGVSCRTLHRWHAQNEAPTWAVRRLIEFATGIPPGVPLARCEWSGWAFRLRQVRAAHHLPAVASGRRKLAPAWVLESPDGRAWTPYDLILRGGLFDTIRQQQAEIARLRGPAQGLLLLA